MTSPTTVPAPRPATCRSCTAPVRWVVTVAGRRTPLDPTPTPDGNVVLVRVDGHERARVLTGDALPVEPGVQAYVPHWTTCPDAEHHRAKRAPKPVRRCQVCSRPLDAVLAATDRTYRTHPACDLPDRPRTTGRPR